MNLLITVFFAALITLMPGGAEAAASKDRPLTIAVSANALRPMAEVAEAFERTSGIELRIVSGSTGKLYMQIVQGAPFDIFFAADRERPRLLVEKGFSKDAESFEFVRGSLTIWTRDFSLIDETGLKGLTKERVLKVAVANPETAPYGKAAIDALKAAGLYEAVKAKLVYGESVSQAFSFAFSGNADAAIVAPSTAFGAGGVSRALDPSLYSPIVQEAVVLKDAPESAQKFVEFVKGNEAAAIFDKYGYQSAP